MANKLKPIPRDKIPKEIYKRSASAELIDSFLAKKGCEAAEITEWMGNEVADDSCVIHSASTNLRNYIKKNHLPLRIMVRKGHLYVTRTYGED